MKPDESPLPSENELESLEGSSTVIEPNSKDKNGKTATGEAPTIAQLATPGQSSAPHTDSPVKKTKERFKRLTGRFNIYLLLHVLIMLIAVVVIAVAFIKNRKAATTPSITAQNLTQKQLEQLANSDVSVGNNKQILNVQSNAVFAGQVLVRQDLEVAGTIKAGGSLNLPGITVSGNSTFSQIQTGTLTVSGNTAIQGQLTASGGLNVSGNATFAGNLSVAQLTASKLTLNGDLNLDHHISAGGPTPSRTNGSALGNGGTASVSGSDTAGTVNINTGTGPGAGCFIAINFASKFNATPHVVATPVGSAAGGIAFYVNRSTTSMSICTANTPPASTSFAFDYVVFD